MLLLTYIKWNGSHSLRAKPFLLDLFYPCDLNSRTAYLPAEESALLFTTTFESRTSFLLRSVIDPLSSWRAEGDAVSNRQNVARHFEHFSGRSWSSSLQRGHFILCVLGNLFPWTSKGRHLSCERALFSQKRKICWFLEAKPGWYRSLGRVSGGFHKLGVGTGQLHDDVILLQLPESLSGIDKFKTNWILVVVVKYRHRAFVLMAQRRGVRGGGEMSPRKSVVRSACQYDVTSRVSDFQNGQQSVHRRDG